MSSTSFARRAAVAAVLALALLVPATGVPARAQVTAQAVAGAIDRTDRDAVVAAYTNQLLPALSVKAAWTGGDVSACNPGTETAKSRNATIAAVNYYRSMAGLPKVKFDNPDWDRKAQAAALIMHANDTLTHDPWPSMACYSDDGYDGASNSNIALGVAGAKAVEAYMIDYGPHNAQVGHRRWILYPRSTRMGTGSTPRANALWVLDDAFGPRPSTTDVTWVAWPPSGYVPWEALPHQDAGKTLFRWSLSSNAMPNADYSAAVVTMKLGTESLVVTPESRGGDAGDTALVWTARRSNGGRFPIESDAVFTVTVSGIKEGTTTVAAHTYKVRAVRAVPDTTPPPQPGYPRKTTGGIGRMAIELYYSAYDPRLADQKGMEVRIIQGGKPPSRTTGSRVCRLLTPKTACVAKGLKSGVKYTMGVWAFDYAGNHSKRRAVYFDGTTVTAAAKPKSVARGKTVKITGTLYHNKPSGRTILSGKQVVLQSREWRGGRWQAWARTGSTLTTAGPTTWGQYRFSSKVSRKTQFRVKYAGDAWHTGDYSPNRTVTIS